VLECALIFTETLIPAQHYKSNWKTNLPASSWIVGEIPTASDRCCIQIC